MCKAVLFDFNGTLLPDSPQNEAAWLEFAKTAAGKVLTPAEFQKNVHGKNNRLVLEYLFERPLTKEEALELGEQKEDIYREMVRQSLRRQAMAMSVFTLTFSVWIGGLILTPSSMTMAI